MCQGQAKRTIKSYESNIRYFRTFCAKYGISQFTPSPKIAQLFLAWLGTINTWDNNPLSYNTADTALCAMVKSWTFAGLQWDRKQHEILRRQMIGFRMMRPAKKRTSKPITMTMVHHCINGLLQQRNTYTLTLACAALGAYYFGLRSGEYTSSNYSIKMGSVLFTRKQLQFVYDQHGRMLSVIITIPKSKGNQHGDKLEMVEAACTCRQDPELHCLPCLYKELFRARNRCGTKVSNDSPVLVINNKPMRHHHIAWLVRKLATELGLDPNHYHPHGFRSGRATDMAKNGVPEWAIQKWGRWVTDVWINYYAKLDHSDLAKLTHTVALDTTLVIFRRDNGIASQAKEKQEAI